jgi:lysozyme
MNILDIIKGLIQLFTKKTQDTVEVIPQVVQAVAPVQSSKMQISKRGLLELADREGLALTPYYDSVGVKTVGIGLTRSDIKDLASWPWDKSITVKEAVDMYKKHVQPYADAVVKALKVPVTQPQFDALVSITYNIGIGGMQGSTFMKRINAKDSMNSIVNAILMWNKPKEIQGRRQKEAELFAKGKYTNTDGSVTRVLVNPVSHKPKYSGRIKIEEYL